MTADRSRRSQSRSATGSKAPLTPDQTRAWVQTYGRHARIYAWGFFALVALCIFGLIWWEMGEVNDDVLYSFAFAATVTFLLARWSRKTATQSWTGVVEDMHVKEVRVTRDGGQPDEIVLRPRALILTRNGKRLTLRLTEPLCEYFVPGDMVFKISGLDWPEKAGLDSQERVCLACGNLYAQGAGSAPAAGPRSRIMRHWFDWRAYDENKGRRPPWGLRPFYMSQLLSDCLKNGSRFAGR